MKENNRNQAMMVAAVLLLVSVLPAQAQFSSRREVSQTPYDAYMGAFRSVAERGPGQGLLTTATVEGLTERAYDFRYDHIEAYRARSPEEVESSGRGDCKDKALWLYSKLAAAGARDMQLVVGKKDNQAQEFHAWLYLSFNGRTYLLDPTFSGSMTEVSEVGADEYIPVYAYDNHGSYIYETATAALNFDPRYQTPIPTVAGAQ